MFLTPRTLQFDSAKAVLNCGNAILNKKEYSFSDIRDKIIRKKRAYIDKKKRSQ